MPRSAPTPAGPPPGAAAPTPQGNRTDLATPAPSPVQPPGQPNGQQPITVPTGLPYGENQALQGAQKAVPLPGGAGAPPPAAAGGPAGPGQLPQGALDAATQFTPPNFGPLGRPTERPNEPITAGLPSGPGPGPSLPGSQGTTGLSDLLGKMASASGSAALSQLAQRAQGLSQ